MKSESWQKRINSKEYKDATYERRRKQALNKMRSLTSLEKYLVIALIVITLLWIFNIRPQDTSSRHYEGKVFAEDSE